MPDNICQLVRLVEEMPAYNELINKLKHSSSQEERVLVLDAAKPYLIAALFQKLQVPLLVVTSQPENAKKLFEQVSLWCNSDNLLIFPEPINIQQRTIADLR